MSEMVEKVARAILKCRFYDCEPEAYDNDLEVFFMNIDPGHVEDAQYEARAAIEAMREPTDAMVDVGQDAFAEGINMVAGHPEPSDEASYQTYITMIDAALSEVEG